MTEQNVAELIAEARANVESAASSTPGELAERIRRGEVSDDRLRLLAKLADALEAEHERAEAAETQARLNDRAFRNAVDRRVAVEAERDAACAVVEQAKATAEHYHDVDMFDLLSIVPADALRDVKAQVWDEGGRAVYDYCWRTESAEAAGQGVMIQEPKNPYREGADR